MVKITQENPLAPLSFESIEELYESPEMRLLEGLEKLAITRHTGAPVADLCEAYLAFVHTLDGSWPANHRYQFAGAAEPPPALVELYNKISERSRLFLWDLAISASDAFAAVLAQKQGS